MCMRIFHQVQIEFCVKQDTENPLKISMSDNCINWALNVQRRLLESVSIVKVKFYSQ